MRIDYFCHLPAVALPEGIQDYTLCSGMLMRLPFDEWHSLDGSFELEWKKYEKSAPVFYCCSVETNEEDKIKWFQSIENTVHDITLSLLLNPGHFLLPDVSQSCGYLAIDGKVTQKHIGAFNREWIVYGNVWNYKYTEENLRNVDAVFNYIADFSELNTYTDLYNAIYILRETAFVDYAYTGISGQNFGQTNYKYGFIRIVSFLESVLFPKDKTKRYGLSLTRAFGMYGAFLFERDYDNLPSVARQLSYLYTLRSKLVHGVTLSPEENERAETFFMWGRSVFSHMILRMLVVYKNGITTEPIMSLLQTGLIEENGKVSFNKEAHASFNSRLA